MAQRSHQDEVNLRQLTQQIEQAIFPNGAVPNIAVTGSTNQFMIDQSFFYQQDRVGRYRLESFGELGSIAGFDGEVAWHEDWSGNTRRLKFADADRDHLTRLMQFGAWLHVVDNLHLDFNEAFNDEAVIGIDIRLEEDSVPATLLVDRSRRLPVAIVFNKRTEDGQLVKELSRLEDYRLVAGQFIPHLTQWSLDGRKFTETVSEVSHSGSFVTEMSPTKFEHVVYSTSQKTLTVKRAKTGHLLLRATLADTDPIWLIFDTGAGATVIDSTLARGQGATEVGAITLQSMLGEQTSSVCALQQLDVGPLVFEEFFGIEMDLSPFESVMGEKISGIVGYDLFAKAVVEIDLAADKVSVFDPSEYVDENVDWQELQLDQRLPLVSAQLAGFNEELYRIDVGASGEFFSRVVFHYPYVQENELAKRYGTTPFSLLEPHRFMEGEVERFRVAGIDFQSPHVGFTTSDTVPFNGQYSKGNIGIEFLSEFQIILDYSRNRFAMVPRSVE